MATATNRASPPTHPTVYVGLALSAAGLILAVYAYSGIRVYDITYAVVAVLGGVVCLSGILLSAWGRAIMAARAGRMRRAAIQTDALKLATEGIARAEVNPRRAALEAALEQPPTVAAPPGKESLGRSPGKMFSFRNKDEKKKPEESAGASAVFAFRRKAAPAVPLAAPEEKIEMAAPIAERLEIRCPQCSTVFQVEGVRPFDIKCPSCAFAGAV